MREELTGRTFHRLTVVSEGPPTNGGMRRWHCRCDCGNNTLTSGADLKRGHAKSCGWLYLTREFQSWVNMMARCHNVCDRWRESVANFYADMGPKPTAKHQIERRDNDGPYCPENCYWATRKEQAQNTRASLKLTHNGETLTLAQWAERTGLRHSMIQLRLKRGWSVAKSLSAPRMSFLKRLGKHL